MLFIIHLLNISQLTTVRWRRPVCKPSESRPTMSAEIPKEGTYQRTCTDSHQSVQSPAPIPPTSGSSVVQHRGDGLARLACQGEPVVGETHPHLSSLLSPDDALPTGQYQPTAGPLHADDFQTVNQTMQQVRITYVYYTKSQWLKEKSTAKYFHPVKNSYWWCPCPPHLGFLNVVICVKVEINLNSGFWCQSTIVSL